MIIAFVNGWYMATDQRIGAWSIQTNPPSLEQFHNANIIRSFFLSKNWTLEAICGMLGCIQGESTINPAFIQDTHRFRLPNNGADLSDVPNNVMENFYSQYYGSASRGYAIGLVQWDGYSNRNGLNRQKLVAYAEDNNIIWYDGWTQLYRINGEQVYDVQHGHTFFNPIRWNGTMWDFTNYPYATTLTPEDCASIWTYAYERNAGGPGFRPFNARWWYDYFTSPDAPAIIDPEHFLEPLPYLSPPVPPFDPTQPEEPEDPRPQPFITTWLISQLVRKKKGEKYISCRRI